MHLRRALMLLVLVLGVAAVVAALGPGEQGSDDASSPLPAPAPAPGAAPARPIALRLDARRPRRGRQEMPVGAHVAVTVAVDAAGEVAVPQLGLLAFAEPRAPAALDLLLPRAGSYEVRFDPFGAGPPRTLATLVAAR